MRNKKGQFIKGVLSSPKPFPKGHSPWNKGKKTIIHKTCLTCGKQFSLDLRIQKRNQKFCSRKCIRNVTQFPKGHQMRLGKKPPENAWENKNSKETRFQKGHKINRGRIPWNKDKDFGGNENLKRKIMGLSIYRKWRNDIKKRDKNKCVRCGLKDRKLEVDHYPIPFAKIVKEKQITNIREAKSCKELWDKNNARSLCQHCHKEITYWQQNTRDTRKIFMDTLIELAEKDDSIILLIPDVGFSYMDEFQKRFNKRFFNTGVTEQTTILIAAGLALSGFKPYVFSMINFVVFRPYEAVRNAVCLHNANVKIIGVKGSEKYKFLGFSHNLIAENEEIEVLEHLPNLKSFVVKTPEEVRKIILETYKTNSPCYIRI